MDTKICKGLNYHRFLTNDMFNESEKVKENAEKINIEKINRIPMLLFISNYSKWENLIREYIKDFEVEILTYNAGHYLHNIFPDDISNKSKIFIKNIIK